MDKWISGGNREAATCTWRTWAAHLEHAFALLLSLASIATPFARARLARESFQQALDELHELAEDDSALHQQLAWQKWRTEAEAGQRAAMARLTELRS